MIYRSSHQLLSDFVAWTFADGPAENDHPKLVPTLTEAPAKAERPRVTQDELTKMFAAELYGRAA